jgi:hypothetical protein
LLVLIGLFTAHCGDDNGSSNIDGGLDAGMDFAEPHDLAAPDLLATADLTAPADLSGDGCSGTAPSEVCIYGSVRRIIDDSLLTSSDQVLVQIYDPLAFASNPNGPALSAMMANKGTFSLRASALMTGIAVLVVRDPLDGVPDAGTPKWMTTAVALQVAAGTIYHADAWATRTIEAQAWSLAGTDYVTGGALVARYFDDAAQGTHTAYETMPASGIQLTIDGAVSATAKYFGATLVAAPSGTATGASGTAIDQVDATTIHTLSGKSAATWEMPPVVGAPGVILLARVHKM